MNVEYVRICPVCETENPADTLHCACGALLSGVDLSLAAPPPLPAPPETAPAAPPKPAVEAGPTCPHADCGMPNPPGEARCLYCNRLLEPPPQAEAQASVYSPLPPGLARRFTVVEQFDAAGSEADLLRATRQADGLECVIKLYRKGLAPDSELLKALNDNRAGHVMRLLEHGRSDGVAYEAMEYCAHGTLREFLQATPPTRDLLRRIAAEIADGLHEIHGLSILHRDLKPENVLVRRPDPLDLVLSDFGIAALRQATQHFTSAARTIHYAAPEALTGVLDEKADWWSLGMILLEAASGRHPFDGLTEQVAGHRLATRPIDVDTVFDTDLRKLCRGLLLRDPARRWGHAEVQRWLAGDATLATPQENAVDLQGRHAYTIAGQACRNPVDLAMAMAAHWAIGASDLRRGSIERWLEQELRDYELARATHRIVSTEQHDDIALLRFILRVAPNFSPVWRGIPLDRNHLLDQAQKAMAGDPTAHGWLDSVFVQGALGVCGEHGHAPLGELNDKLVAGIQRIKTIWQTLQAAEQAWSVKPRSMDGDAATRAVSFDDAVYGKGMRMRMPKLNEVLPPLLRVLLEPRQLEALRGELLAGNAQLAGDCGWFEVFGEIDKLDPAAAVAARRVLNLALEDAEFERKRRQAQHRSRKQSIDELRRRTLDKLRDGQDLARNDRPGRDDIFVLRESLGVLMGELQHMLGFNYLDEVHRDLRSRLESLTEHIHLTQSRLNHLEAEHERNDVWISVPRLATFGIAFLTLSPMLGTAGSLGVLGVAASVATARLQQTKRARDAYAQASKRLNSQMIAILNLLDD